MRMAGEIIVGLDIGTTKICAVVGEIVHDGIEIIGIGSHPSEGLRKGVVINIEKTVKEVKAGKIEFKMDKQSGIHVGVGRVSFAKGDLRENITKIINAIFSSNPALSKPQTVKSICLSTTMGPGLKLDISEFRK